MVIRITYKRGGIGPSYRGAFYSYTAQGREHCAAWPPKRGKPRSEAQAFAQALFTECCRAMKAMDPAIINYARENSHGTPMLPRDGLMAALYGRGPTFTLPNGEKRFAMATRVDMSMLMDNIAWKPGSILYRGSDDLWLGLDPGAVGQILQLDENQIPVWVDQQPGGGGSWYSVVDSTQNTTAYAFKGTYFTPMVDGEFQQIVIRHFWNSGDVVHAKIYAINGSGVIQTVLLDQLVTTTQDGTNRTALVNLEAPIAYTGGTRYVVGAALIGQGGTAAMRVLNYQSGVAAFPIIGGMGLARATIDNPVVGNTLATVAGVNYAFNWKLA